MKSIKNAYEELDGDLKNTRNQRSHEGEFLFINKDNGRYLTFNGGCHKDNFQYICTVEEFNNYKPEKTVHDAVIEFKGECFGSGFISHSETRGWTPIASKHLPMSDCFEVCSLIAFNAYVDLLASNFGMATQSYAEYKKGFTEIQEGFKRKTKENKVDNISCYVCHVGAHHMQQYCGTCGHELLSELIPTQSPEFTQEFRLISGRGETWHKCKVVFKGKRYTVVENENGKEFSRRTAKLVIRDVRPPVELIDGKAYQFEYDGEIIAGVFSKGYVETYADIAKNNRNDLFVCVAENLLVNKVTNIKPLTVEGK